MVVAQIELFDLLTVCKQMADVALLVAHNNTRNLLIVSNEWVMLNRIVSIE